MSKQSSPLMVTVKTVDHTGHTTVVEAIEKAIKSAFKTKFTQGKNLNIRGDTGLHPFELKAQTAEDTKNLQLDAERLHNELSKQKNPVIYLTGALVGGV